MWEDIKELDSYKPVDVNEEILKMKGEFTEQQARWTLGWFLEYNLAFTCRILMGMILHARQVLYIKAWWHNNFNIAIWGRGTGKTSIYDTSTQLLAKDIGLVPITELLPNISFEKEGWQKIKKTYLWNGKGWQETDKIYVQPNKPCLTLKTNRGYELTGSTNHMIKVLDKNNCKIVWKRYHELKVNDYVCISRNLPEFEFEEHACRREAYLIGLLIGDGCYAKSTGRGATITTADQDTIDWVSKNWEIQSYTEKIGTTAIDINLSYKLIDPLFEKYGIERTTSYFKKIPSKIMASKMMLRETLSGLFDTDGTAEKRGNAISFCSTSRYLAKQVHISLSLFGIISTLSEKKTKSDFGKAWVVNITGNDVKIFGERIGFKLSRKQKLINTDIKNNTNLDVVPGAKEFFQANVKTNFRLKGELSKEWRNSIRRKENQEHLSYSSLDNYLKFAKKAEIDDDKYTNLSEIVDENFYFDKIESLTSLNADCIDFNVPDGEMYWANGFINHNSTLAAVFACLYAILKPNTSILIVSQNFRSSRRILENVESIATSPAGALLLQVFKNEKLSRRNDLFQWELKNGSKITAVPLSNGEGLRGLRASVLIVDEALLVPLRIIKEILQPFLVAAGDVTQKLRTREREDALIKKGVMTEEQRTDFPSDAKMILLSSASYQWEDLYKVYCTYLENAKHGTPEEREVASYSVTQVSYEAVPPGFLDSAILKDILSGETPQSIIDKEYRARFIESSDSYFSLKKMNDCTIKDMQEPCVEVVGEQGAEYVLGIDPSFSSAESSDHFAMSLLKVIPKGDKKVGMLVHSYAVAGGNLKDHILYLYYLITHFNIVYIGIDASQGDEVEFINSCNNSSTFKNAGIDLKALDADFGKEDMSQLAQQIKKSYNREARRIVQKQSFHSAFQRAANEYLQACVDYKNIWFASKIQFVDGLGDRLGKSYADLMILNPKTGHATFAKDNVGIYEFMELQGSLVDLTKKECSLVEVNSSELGNQSWSLPQSMKRSKSASRVRKDNYSSLLLANWCLKNYLASHEVTNAPVYSTFEPRLV